MTETRSIAIIRNNKTCSRAWNRLRPEIKPRVLAALVDDAEFCGAKPGSDTETKAFKRIVRRCKRR